MTEKKSKLKLIVGLITAIIFIVIGLSFYALQNLDAIIKQTIETVGSQTTQTPVTLQTVKVSLRSGRGELNRLQINNPSGYQTEYAFLMDKIVLQVDPQSILAPVVIINEITIDGAKLIAEHQGLSDLNLLGLAQNVKQAKAASNPTNSEQSSTEQPPANDPASNVRLMVEKVNLVGNHLSLVSDSLGQMVVTMPDIHLTNIGDKQHGLTPQELTQAILKPLLKQAADSAKDQLKALAKEQGKAKLKSLIDKKAGDAKDKLKSLLGN